MTVSAKSVTTRLRADRVRPLLALLGVGVAAATGAGAFNVAASYLIGLLLVINAAFLAWEMASLILGERAEPDVERAVWRTFATEGLAGEVAGVRAVHLGPDDLLAIVSLREEPGRPALVPWLRVASARARRAAPPTRKVLSEPDVTFVPPAGGGCDGERR